MTVRRHAPFVAICCAIFTIVSAPGTRAGAPPEGPPPSVVLKGHEADLAGAEFSPDGSKVVTASSDHTARI
jgi:WD40 repeat protein